MSGFDCAPDHAGSPYTPKLDFPSTHRLAFDAVRPGASVIDLGAPADTWDRSSSSTSSAAWQEWILFLRPPVFWMRSIRMISTTVCRLSGFEEYDYTLLLDVIEHLQAPDDFLVALRSAVARNPNGEIVISTGNVAFAVVRLMLLIGQFNYGKARDSRPDPSPVVYLRIFSTLARSGRLCDPRNQGCSRALPSRNRR